MMDRTDRHFRYFIRLITRHTLLYTEMITTGAIIYGDRSKFLGFDLAEKPLSLQLGGDNPEQLAACARIAQDWGYDEVNLNVGCPSPRVQSGNFGACLMLNPSLVATAVEKMTKAVTIPVTVKHRIGVDDRDRYEDLTQFVQTVAEAGCSRFTVHARKAWLKGLSPKENRSIPPLRYDLVHRLKRDFPHLYIEINGGITKLSEIQEQLELVDAVMIGRAAYDHPYFLATVDREIYGAQYKPPTRPEIVAQMLPYIENCLNSGFSLNSISRHLLHLFTGEPGSRAWKRYISEHAHLPQADARVIAQALDHTQSSSSGSGSEGGVMMR
ncbi:tRNA dihydrouridine(20/20a) synthase DusA [Gloeocapsa sp. PCC 73106]|uniref:tRNA dihydrouridine(20/20a) synthase DusA n=1 Tax=Gloeocapsa sp. PCC 73106 TaxID=102232 RepID=UPI0002AC45F3|nr:tRNA dihydrouridine(20/20a) synthase DusA [Gloeocapsa sp. PCC 73106]ELR98287.1 tRNA dihydrouridine synthase A [Gloeocapsa sp. PCC 73106]